MDGIAVSNRVVARNQIGLFIKECEVAATRTVERAVKRGARLSKDMAPVGHKADPRTIPLKASITWEMLSSTSGQWKATARHAMAQERGASPHTIEGAPGLRFFWEAKGRMFVPAAQFYHMPGLTTVVNHPGNPAQPYLRPAYEIVWPTVMQIAREEYP